MKQVTVTAEVEIPRPPNFLRMADGQALPVSAVSEDALRQIGEAWTEALIERAREQREDAASPLTSQRMIGGAVTLPRQAL